MRYGRRSGTAPTRFRSISECVAKVFLHRRSKILRAGNKRLSGTSLLYFKSEPSGEGWPTRAGERPAPWTLPQNLIDEARVLADGRIPLPEPERVPWDVLIAQAVNWDIPERLAA